MDLLAAFPSQRLFMRSTISFKPSACPTSMSSWRGLSPFWILKATRLESHPVCQMRVCVQTVHLTARDILFVQRRQEFSVNAPLIRPYFIQINVNNSFFLFVLASISLLQLFITCNLSLLLSFSTWCDLVGIEGRCESQHFARKCRKSVQTTIDLDT